MGSYDFACKQKVLKILPDLVLEVDTSRLVERRIAILYGDPQS